MNNVLVLGASGLLGSELISGQYLKKYQIISLSRSSKTDYNVDLENFNELVKTLEKVKPNVIINLVGLTNIDHCEKFPNEAYRINVQTVENLTGAIQMLSEKPFLIHISTDQVYDGKGFFLEKNINLSNYYAFSKYIGELKANQISSTILRTNFFGKGKSLKRSSLTDWLYTELKQNNHISVFEDVWFNPLSISFLCKIIELTIEKKIEGIFNLGSDNGMNKADFAFYFAKALNLPTSNMKRVKVSDVKFLKAYRPKNMIMNLNKFKQKFNVKLPKLKEEIEFVAKDYK
ncbi:SDR family oxidoreductase [Candidatus Pelagibacter sp.]|nr:SDR family oxidoreductase [Candidatus Pelagibacter sp.]